MLLISASATSVVSWDINFWLAMTLFDLNSTNHCRLLRSVTGFISKIVLTCFLRKVLASCLLLSSFSESEELTEFWSLALVSFLVMNSVFLLLLFVLCLAFGFKLIFGLETALIAFWMLILLPLLSFILRI